MSGLRRLIPLAGSIATIIALSACSSKKDLPPRPGSLTADDPQATALMAAAQSQDAAGDLKKAIKTYKQVATKYPYSDSAAQALFRQATLLEHQGELIKAFDAYEDLIQRYRASSLYTKALAQQATVAHAAADGLIKSHFLGLKSNLEAKKIAEMLGKVRDNAPRAPSAPLAQFTIGDVWEKKPNVAEAVAAFGKLVDDYPNSKYAPEAQYRIGYIYLSQTTGGNQNPATLDRAREGFDDLLLRYPNSARAPDAKARLREIATADIQSNFDIAEFYQKKGEPTSAAFYYNLVLNKAKSGDLHDRAAQALQTLNSQ